MEIYMESDTIKIIIFSGFFIVLMFIFAILNTSYKDTEEVTDVPQWGGKLLMLLFIIAFAALIYKYNSLYLFLAIIVLITILFI